MLWLTLGGCRSAPWEPGCALLCYQEQMLPRKPLERVRAMSLAGDPFRLREKRF